MEPVTHIPPQPWMTAPATMAVMAALTGSESAGPVALFVGGCVRDSLLGRTVGDIDIATSLEPETVSDRLRHAGIKVVPTGLSHGTLTAVVEGRHFEITTLRVDVDTDGRRATVAFTDDWVADAERRDFTVNALFADGSGAIYDPVGGLADLKAGRIRFVGNAEQRIREDVLRLLRFFRCRSSDRLHETCRSTANAVRGKGGGRNPQIAFRGRSGDDNGTHVGQWRSSACAARSCRARSAGGVGDRGGYRRAGRRAAALGRRSQDG